MLTFAHSDDLIIMTQVLKATLNGTCCKVGLWKGWIGIRLGDLADNILMSARFELSRGYE